MMQRSFVRVWQAGLLALALGGVAGCRHQTKMARIAIPPPQPLPVDTTAKVEQPQPMVQTVPLQPTPLPTVTVPTKKKVRKPRKPPATTPPVVPGPVSPPPIQVASVSLEGNGIGALTPGGSDGPQQRKEAADLIAVLGKRLETLPAAVKEKQKDQITRIINFRRQAQAALDSGDLDGALTLATKAKVLLDDLAK